MVYDNIPTLVSCSSTLLAKAAVSLLEHSDEYHKEYHFSYISLHSIKAYDLPIVLHIFCESNYIYLHTEKLSSCITNTIIVDHSNTARESDFAIKYGTMPQGMIVMHS